NGFESVVRECVRCGLKDAGVERARHTMSAIRSTVQDGAMVHRRDRSIILISRLRRHQYGMPSTMAVKHLFTRQTDLHGTARDHRQFAHDNFVIERIALASKASAVRSGNHADMTRRHLQHFSEMPVQIMHILCASPESEFPVMAK